MDRPFLLSAGKLKSIGPFLGSEIDLTRERGVSQFDEVSVKGLRTTAYVCSPARR